MRGMREIGEEAEVEAVEGGTIPGGEEEVTIDDILLLSEMLQDYSRLSPTDHILLTEEGAGPRQEY